MDSFVLSAFRALSVSTLALVATTGLVSATASAMQSANCQAGANHINQFTSTANIFTAFGNAASEPAEGCPLCGVLVTVDGTGMTQTNLGTCGANGSLIAVDGLFGSFTITSAIYNGTSPTALAARLEGLLANACESANITVNAAGFPANAIAVIDTKIAKIDAVTNLPAGSTLTLTAAEANGKFISGAGTVVISSDALTGTSDLTGITTAGLTFPTSAPFLSIGSGGLLAAYPERVSGYTIEGAGTVSLVGTVDFNVDVTSITASVSVDADGVPGTSVAATKTFTLTAAQANAKAIAGAGTTAISGNIGANADFTAISSALDIPGTVSSGATLTLTAAQGNGRSLAGAGSITIATAALTSNTNFRSLTTAGFAFDGSVGSGATLSINAVQSGGCVVSGAGTVDILCTSVADTVGGNIDANVIASGLAGADILASGDGADSISGGDDDDSINAGAGNDSIDGGAGSDTATFAANLADATFSAPATTITIASAADGSDSVTGVEVFVFADKTVYTVGSGGYYASFSDALTNAPAGASFYGASLAISSTTPGFTDTASLNAILARCVGGSTFSVDVLGMNKAQLSAVSANTATLGAVTYPAVQVVNAGDPSGYFTTIGAAITFASAGDTINVAAGTYAENLSIAKSLDVRGPNWNVSPNGGTRAAEAVLVPASTNTATGAVVTITSSGVSFRGFTVDGDNTALAASGVGLGGALGTSIDAARCVFLNANGVNGVTLSKNIAKNAVNGLRIEQTTNYFSTTAGALRSTNILLDDNLVQDMTGTGIRLGNSMYAKVTNNTVTNADNGIAFTSFRISDAGSAADRVIQGNTISSRYAGIWVNLFHASPYALVNNTITVAPAATSMAPTPQNRTAWYGIMYSTVSAPQNFTNQVSLPLVATPEWWTATGNTIDGAALESTSTGHGYWLYYVDNNRDTAGVDHFGQISGGSVSNVAYGIMLKNKDADPATNFGNSAVGAHAAVSGVAFNLNAGGTGFRLIDDAAWVTGNPAPLVNKRNVQLAVGAGNSITGGATGVSISRPATFAQPDYNPIVGGSLSDLAFSGQTGDYIALASPSAVDATGASFGGSTGAAASDSANFAIANKITDKLDTSSLGRVTVEANNLFVTSLNSVAAGVALVSAGETINVQAHAYTDGVVTVNTDNLTVNSEAGVSGYSFLLGGAANLSLSGAGDVNADGSAAANTIAGSAGVNAINGLAGADTLSGGDANDTLNGGDDADTLSGNAGDDTLAGGNGNDSLDGGAGSDSLDGGAGIDSASYGISYVGALSGSDSLSIDGDTVVNVENIAFSDATVTIVGRGGSEYLTLNAANAAVSGSNKLWGVLAINSATFATAADLNALTARFVDGSAVSVDVLGMNKVQLAAVAGNATTAAVVVYPPVQVVNAGEPSGYFTTIGAAITFATAGDIVNVAAGTYAEDLIIAKALSLRGPNYGVNPNTGTRGAEAIIVPASNNPSAGKLIQVLANDISIDGFTLDGDNAALSGGTAFGGIDSNCARALRNEDSANTSIHVSGIDMSHNIVRNFTTTGYYLLKNGTLPNSSGNYVRNNLFQKMRFRAIYAQGEYDVVITGNVMDQVHVGVAISSVGTAAATGFQPRIANNTINLTTFGGTSRHMGISVNHRFGTSTRMLVEDNTITADASLVNPGEGLRITTMVFGGSTHATGNTVDCGGTLTTGLWLWNNDGQGEALVSGGSFSNAKTNGLYLTDFDAAYAANSYSTGNFGTVSGTSFSTIAGGTTVNVHWTGTGTNLGPCTLTMQGSTAVGGLGTGVALNGAKARVSFSGESPASLSGNLASYFVLSNAGATNPAADIDATAVAFGGSTGAAASDTANFAIANKITDKLDTTTLGRVVVKANNLFVTSLNSVAAGVALVSEGETVNVQAGAYTDSVVTVNTADLTVNSEAGVSGFSFLLGSASNLTLAGAGDVNADGSAAADTIAGSLGINTINGFAGADTLTGGDANDAINGGDDGDTLSGNGGDDSVAGGAGADSLDGGAGSDSLDGGAGIDSASYGISYVGALSGSDTLSIDGDTVVNVENISFSDATVTIVGRGGSEYLTLNAANAAVSSANRLWGVLAINSSTFSTAAELDALTARFVDGSTVSVDVLGMNATQLAAVAGNAAASAVVTYPPVQVVSAGAPSGYFTTIGAAITFASAGDTINVAAGTYAENLSIAKSLDVRGPNWNVSPNGGTRAAEAVLVPASTNTATGAVVTITSSGVSFRGFTVDGDNTALAASGVGLGGALGTSIDAARCVFLNANGVNGVTLSKNIAKNAVNGLRIEQTTNYFSTTAGALRSTNILLDDNLVQDMTGTGIRLGNSMYAKVTNNTVTNADNGIAFTSFRISDAGSAADRVIQGNTISSRYAGIWVNLFHASPYALVNNTITVAPAATSMAPTPQNRTAWYGIMYSTVSAPQNFTNQVSLPLVATPEWWTATGNTIDGAALESTSTGHGYWLYYVDNNRDTAGVDHFGQISGGSVSNVAYGIMLKNKDADPATNFGNSAVGAHAAVSGVAFNLNAGGTGFRLIDDAAWVTGNPAPLVNKRNVQLAVGAGNSITGGATGVSISRPATFAQPDYNPLVTGSLSDLAFSGQTGDYILLASPSAVDATGASFGGANGATASNATLFSLQGKITDAIDNTTLGFVRVKAANVFVPSGGVIANGVAVASAGDTVNLDAATYTENVTLAKRVALVGAGSGADGTVLSSSTTATPVISVTGSGLDADNQLVIKDVRVAGAANASGSDGIAVYGDTPAAFVKVENAYFTGFGQGVHYRSGSLSNVSVLNSTFHANNFGVRVATAVASMNGMTIDGCTMTEQTSSAISTNPSGSQTVVNTNFTISNSTFTNNSRAGVTNQHDLSFFGFRGNATLSNVTVTSGNGASANSNSYGIVFTNGSGRAALGTVSLSNVTVQGHVGKGALTFQLYNELSGVSLSGVNLRNCVAPWGDLIVDSTDADALNAGDTSLKTLNVWNAGGVNATGVSFFAPGATTAYDRSVLAENFSIAAQVGDVVDAAGLGLVRTTAGKIYVNAAAAAGSIYRAIGAASAGDEIVVQDGTALVLTTEITKSVTISGNFAISSANIPTDGTATAVLSSFTSRLTAGSTLAANFAGMNANQVAAVNANFAYINSASGNPVSVTRGGSIVGYAPTIQLAIDWSTAGDTLNISAGTYAEALTVSKTLTLRGPNAGKSGTDVTRGAEAMIIPPAGMVASYADAAYVITVPEGATGVVFDGLMVDGDNPATTSPFTANGANPDADEAFAITGDGAIVRNCVIKNAFQFGVAMGATGATTARFGEVTDNYLENIPYWAAVLAWDSYYAKIDGNTIVNAWRGVQTNNHYLPVPSGKTASVSSNTITSAIQDIAGDATYADYDGILHNLQYGDSAWTIANNTITNTSASNANADCDGIEVWSIQTGATVSMSGNTIAGFPNGYTLWHCPATAGLTVSGGSVTGAINGVVATNYDNYGDADSSSYTISGVAISGSTNGVVVVDSASNTNSATLSVALSGGSVSGGATGLSVNGADATVTVATTAFSGQSGDYISLAGNANGIDATTATFAGSTGAAATLAANYDIEDKISHKLDDSSLGLVRVKASNVFVSATGNIGRGVTAASTGDTVNVEAGSYTENVTLAKRVALVGAGSGADGTVLSSSTTATPVISVTGSGLDADNQLVIKDVRVAGAANASGSDGIAVYGDTPAAFVKVENAYFTGFGQGVHYRSGSLSNVSVLNSTFHANNFGVRVATAVASMNGMTIDGCTMTEQTSSAISTNPSGSQTVVNTNFTISNSTFTNNSRAGVTNQHDLSFFGFRGNATLSNVTVTSGNGASANSNSYGIVFTNGSGRAALGTVSLSNVTVQGHVGKGALTFQLYNELSGVSLSGVNLRNCVAPWGDLIVDSTDADALNAGDTSLKTLNVWNAGGVNATGVSFFAPGATTAYDRSVLAENFSIAAQVGDVVDAAGLGLVRTTAGKIYVNAAAAAGSIYRAIGAASAGDEIVVQDGTALVLTTEITKSVTISGNFTINAAGLPDSASASTVLSSFLSRLATGSTATANMLGMTANQIAAVNANFAYFTAFSNNPVAIVRGGADVAYYTTIQPAIDGASAGDTIRVAAGTYAESLDVTKSLTLRGANAGINPNTGTRGAETVIQSALPSADPANRAFQVRSGNQTVVIDGFKIVGGNPLHDGNETNFARTSDVTFTNNIAQNCGAIFSGSSSSWDEVVISNNTFTSSNATATTSAMQIQTPRVATVTGNTITNAAYAGILVDGVDTATVSGNTIDGATVQGIQLAGAMGTSTIDGNTITNANTSLGADRGAIRLYGTAFTGATTVSNNTISASHNGLAIRNGENWTGKTLNLSGNAITVGTGSSVYHGGTGEIDFTGANTVNGIAVSGASLSDLYAVSGTVSDGMDVSGKGLVRIKSANVYVVSTGSVALGVAAASANDTVNVAAGNFGDGAITLNKVLTVNGAAPASGALGYSFTLGTADSVVLAGDAAIDVTGNGNANAITANSGANVLAGAAGIDAATMGIATPSSLAVSSDTIAVGADTVSGIERLVFTDGTVAVIGVTGSEYGSLNQVLALNGGEKLFGTLAINSSTFATAAELDAITARFVSGSTVSVDVLGMNATQLAAVAGNATASGVVVYPPVQVVSGTSITGYFATIQAGIDFASAGDVVNVAAGTYAVSNAVTVSKAISLRGAQYGVDARTRAGTESVINASGTSGASGAGVIVSAGVVGATIDGFTVTGAANGLAGIYLSQTSAGTTVANNIVTGNNTGIMPNSGSATNTTVIERNRFSDNLAAGSTSSPAVYIDNSTVGGSVSGLVIRNNLFTNTAAQNSFAIVIDNEGTTHLTGVTISGNEFTANSLGMMLVGLADSTVSGNTFNSNYAIEIYDGLAADVPANANLTISGNTFTSPTSAVRISDFGFGAYSGTLALSGNTFTGCTNAIINGGAPAVVSAVGATFDGVLLDGATSLDAIYTITGKVLDSVDGGYGDVVLRAANVFVSSSNSVANGIAAANEGDTVNIQSGSYLDGAVTINTADLTVNSGAGVSGFSFTLGTANSLVLAGAGDVNVLGNANANSVTASDGANAINGDAGVDSAVFASVAPSSLAAGSTISVGADSVTNVEKLVFSDATIALVGTGGSEYATLNAALGATTTERLFGTLAINSSTFATAAELDAITARFVGGSTVSVDVLGMNDVQLAAVAGNATASGVVVYPPMQVVRGGVISGYFPTIAEAMTFAADGDTVNIAAGTYTEQFAITKDITVQGPNHAVAGNGTRGAEAILDYSAATPAGGQFVLVAKGALKGVKIRDNLLPVGGEASPRIAVRIATGATAAVSNSVFFRDSGLNAPAGHPQRNVDFRAMHVDQTAGGSATISGNFLTGAATGLFSNQGWFRGVWTQGVASAVAVTNNVFDSVRSPMNIQDDMSMLTVSGNAFNGVGVTVLSFGNSGIAGFTDSSTVSTSFTLGANAFNGSGTLFNLTAVPAGFTLDATASSFNGTAFSAMDLAGHMEVAARSVQSITNATKNGLVRSKAGNVYVPGVVPAVLAGGISRAITVASVGDTVNVSEGTFVGNINIGKRLALVGAGAATVVSSSTPSTPAITVSGSGSNATDRLVVSNLTATGATGGSNSGSGIYVSGSGAISNLTFDGVTVTGNTGFGIAFNNTFATSDVKILNSTVSSNTDVGIRVASATPSFTDLLVDGCTVSSNGTFGFASNPSQTNTVVNTRFTIQNSTFSGNNTVGGANNHVMFFGAFQGDATISNVDISANQRAHGIVFNGWGNTTVAQWPAAGTIVMNDVVFSGTIDKTCTYFYRYSTLAGVTMTDCDMSAVTTLPTWHQLSADSLGTLNAGNTKLRSISSGGCAINATACSFYDSVGAVDKSVLANLYRIEDAIRHQVDTGIPGLVRVNSASVYLSKNSGTLENAIAAASEGDVVYVEDGTAWTLVNEITKSITFSGNFVVTATNIPTGSTASAVLSSFVTRGAPGATFSAVTTGMSADQLSAVGNSYASFNGGVTGDLTLTSAQSAAQISAILAGAGNGSAYVVATGMGDDQLNAVAAAATKVATDGITGTMIVTSAIADENLGALLGKAALLAATVEINASGMTDGELSTVVLAGDRVDEAYNLALDDGQTDVEITALLGKSVAAASTGKLMAIADATSMVAAKLNALGGSFAKLRADGIDGSVALNSGVTDANFTNLFAKIALSANVRVDGTSLGASTITIVSSNIAKVDSAFALLLTNSQTATELGNVLGVSDAASATANATGMDSTAGGKLSKLADNYTRFPANGISGTFTITSGLTPTQITNLLSKVDFGTGGSSFLPPASITIDATGMSSGQLSSIAAAVAGAGTPANQNSVFDILNLSLTSAQNSGEIATLLNVTNAGEATVDATGMSAAQLGAVADASTAVDQITGTIQITADLTAAQIAAIMGNASTTSANVVVNTDGMSAEQQGAIYTTGVMSVELSGTVATGNLIVANVNVSGLSQSAVGVQARVLYDATRLEFVADYTGENGVPDGFDDSVGGTDFPQMVYVTPGVGMVSFATGVDIGGDGTGVTTGNVAQLRFRALVPFCDTSGLVSLASTGFQNRLTTNTATTIPFIAVGSSLVSSVNNLQLAGVPSSDTSLPADAGTTAGAAVAQPTVTASNNCDPAVAVVRTITYPGGATGSTWPARFPVGVSTVTWTATDAGGNVATATRTYTVANYQLATIDVNLGTLVPAGITFNQNIRLRLSSGDVVTVTVPFNRNDGAVIDAQIPVRDDYTCITAKDAGHTLANAQTLAVSGTKYVASAAFSLRAGDSNDDNMVDILDFGVFVSDRGAGKTAASRSNFNRDLFVNNADFASLSLNFLQVGDTCAGGFFDGGDQPIARISVKELRRRGLGELEQADINMDGWVDQIDIGLAMQGQYRRDYPNLLSPEEEVELPNW